MAEISESTLLINENRIYHLDLLPEELADNIVVVGDPSRAEAFGKMFLDAAKPIVARSHRGLVTMTGTTAKGMPLSFVTTGMGTGSVEIVINEIIALKTVDLTTRTRIPRNPAVKLRIIRVGTCGVLQDDTPTGTLVVTKYAIGLDNTGLFYNTPLPCAEAEELEQSVRSAIDAAVPADARFKGCIKPYVAVPDQKMKDTLVATVKKHEYLYKEGFTCSAAGFFTCQGRELFAEEHPTVASLDKVLQGVRCNGLRIENFEMEISAITQVTAAFDWVEVGCVCLALANRSHQTTCQLNLAKPETAGEIAVETLETLAGF